MRERLSSFAWLLMIFSVLAQFWPFFPFRPFWAWNVQYAWEPYHQTLEGQHVLGAATFAIGLVLAIACRPRR